MPEQFRLETFRVQCMQTMVQIPPGPGPRPVGRRTSARPVGRLGDGVGTDNCAYKSLGNCAMFFDFLDG